MLLGMWDQASRTLTITRPNGLRFSYSGAALLARRHKVFGVETVSNEVHALAVLNNSLTLPSE